MRKTLMIAVVAMGATLVASGAWASPLTFDVNPSVSFQQTINNPCVIGDSSCKEPAGMTYTQYPGTPLAAGSTYDSYSPSYTSSALQGFVGGTSFKVGIDVNYAKGNGLETLQDFSIWVCPTGTCATYTANQLDNLATVLGSKDAVLTAAGYSLFMNTTTTYILDTHNGNGYSDALSANVDISGLPNATFVFEGSIGNDSDGMEEFFLIRGDSLPLPPNIPEPATLALLGTGLAGLAFALRRKSA